MVVSLFLSGKLTSTRISSLSRDQDRDRDRDSQGRKEGRKDSQRSFARINRLVIKKKLDRSMVREIKMKSKSRATNQRKIVGGLIGWLKA